LLAILIFELRLILLILLLLNQKIRKNRIKKFHDSKIMKNSNHTNFEKPIKKKEKWN